MRLPMHLKTILIGLAVIVVSFVISLKAMDWLAPRATVRPPALAELPPLPPAPRSIHRDGADCGRAVGDPRRRRSRRAALLQRQGRQSDLADPAERRYRLDRLARTDRTTGAQDVLTLTTPLTGTLNVTGSLSAKATGAVGDALGGLLGGNVAKQIGSVNIKNLNASAEIKGNVVISARPKIAANWRIEPNLAAQVNLGDSSLTMAGARVNVPAQVKPLIDKTVAEQISLVQARMRNDPAFEQNARVQWAKACRSIPLQGTGAGSTMPALWLELRPTRAIAAQPRVDASDADADARHRGGDPHHPGRDQAQLPVPRHDRHRAADAGAGRDRRPRRHALHRDQQNRRSPVRRKDFSGRWLRLGRRHRQARHASRRPATAC